MKTVTGGQTQPASPTTPPITWPQRYIPTVLTRVTHTTASNRLMAQQATKSGQSLQSFTQAYDANSNITSLTEPSGTNSYSHDSLNRLTKRTWPPTAT